MSVLDEERQKIDTIDAQLTKLFEERFEAVRKIIAYKIENHVPIKDNGREKEIFEKNASLIQNPEILPYFKKAYEEMLELSKIYQKQYLDQQ